MTDSAAGQAGSFVMTASGSGAPEALVSLPQAQAGGVDALHLPDVARQVRRDILTMLHQAGSGHPGGSLSAVEMLVALYWRFLRHDPPNPQWPDRDRFILSKGHAAPVLYAVLANRGYFPREELATLRRLNSRLQGHTDSTCTPGVEMSAGSLGQGLSFGIGMALAARLDGRGYRVFVMLGDGECNEGQVWEAALAASHFKLDTVTVLLDRNRVQNDGPTAQIMDTEPMADKWRAFGWSVAEVDGHDFAQVLPAIEAARSVRGRPSIVIGHTTKGKGVSFMEGTSDWHGKAPNADELARALAELDAG